MPNNSSTSLSFLNQIKIGSTKSIVVLFSLLILMASVLFFYLISNHQTEKIEGVLLKSNIYANTTALLYQIENEAQNSLNNGLTYSISKSEIERFQTAYSLKSSKELYEELNKTISSSGPDAILTQDLNDLSEILSNYNQNIAELINTDGQLQDIINQISQSNDSIQGNLLFDISSIGANVPDTKILRNNYENIQNQLSTINNYLYTINSKQLNEIKSDSPLEIYIIFSAIIVLLLGFMGYHIISNQELSITELENSLEQIAKGELPEKEIISEGEMRKIVVTSNDLVNYLDDASQFAIKIGDGNFDYEFHPKSNKDTLGNSLIEMRNRLQEVAIEDKIRHWKNEGQAKFGDILRQYNNNVESLGSHLLAYLIEYMQASQGALFVLNKEDDKDYLELLSAYACKRRKFVEQKFEPDERLAGRAFLEGKTIYITDVKNDHYNIQTGLGESKPSSILIVPLKDEEKIEGILEIASLKEFEKYQIEFIESIGGNIASSLISGKSNQITNKLLLETQEKAEEMKAQEEELRQNMEELAATQEQMERRNKEMEEIQKEMAEEKYLLNALLDGTQDHIYFKDKESKFIRVSKSMVKLFDKESDSEIIGKSDFDFNFEERAKIAYEDEQKIISTEKPLVDAVEKEVWDDGQLTWVSTTINPLRDLDGNIVGTFGISRDITSNKLNELEINKQKVWFKNFFKFDKAGFVVLDQLGQTNFISESILQKLKKESSQGIIFEDIFINKNFTDFLTDIDFKNKKNIAMEITLKLNDIKKEKLNLLAISGDNENEDGTQNIFLIQK